MHTEFRLRSTLCAVALVASLLPVDAFAQNPRCDSCFELRRVTELNGAHASLVGDPKAVALFADKYYVLDSGLPMQIPYFSLRGEYVGTIGREGTGAGEFKRAVSMGVFNDRLYVYDAGNTKEIAIDSSGTIVSESRIPQTNVVGAVRIDDRVVTNAIVYTPSRIGLPLHVIDNEGTIESSFGSEEPSYNPERPWIWLRALAVGERGVWAAARSAYVLELWSAQGELLQRIEPQQHWFPKHADRPIGTADPPPPWVTGIREIGNQVFILVGVPDPNYSAILGPRRQTPRGLLYDVDREEELYDTVIEVFDVVSGRLTHSTRVKQFLLGFVTDDLVFGLRRDSIGVPVVTINRIRLHESAEGALRESLRERWHDQVPHD